MLGQVVHEQPGDLELVDEVALLVGRAGAVGVAVEEQPEVVPPPARIPSASSMFGRIGSGLTPPKYGLRSWWISVTRIRPPARRRREPARAGAPHRLDEDVDVGRLEGVEVDRPPDEPLVALVRVVALDEAGRLGVGERPALDRPCRRSGDRRLEDGEDVRPGGRAGRRLDLEAVVGPRVVAGGDHDAGRGAALDDLVRAHLGRHGVPGDRRPGCRGRGGPRRRPRRSAPRRTAGRRR